MTLKEGKTCFCTVVVKEYRSVGVFASRRVREALEKSIAKGLSVEEMVNVEGEVEFIIQLNVASEFVGELA